MKRRVIQIADKTLVVSLPTDWVRQWGVKKGEEVDVVETGPRLIVSTAEPRMLRKGVVDVSNASERALRWLLSSLHKKGYDEIEIKVNDFQHTSVIDQLLKDLFLGFAVVHRSGSSCIIRSLAKELDDQLQVIVRRAFLVTLSLADRSLELIRQKKYSELNNLLELEKQNNQLTNFCERILNKRGLDEPAKTSFLYVIMWNLEKIADEYKYICESANNKLSKSSVDVFAEVNSLLRRYYELFYKFDVVKLSELSDDFKVLKNRIEQLIVKSEDAVVLSHLLHIALKTADFSASTFALND
ncbi:MAG: AbrB/MazE/SpoVT family DNA-binding domain-containing protein [Candidatus Woesearchaeota archaeon]|nr:AbrB/MazE/SpoVT family DNA-binding domain-containing protein [Candidatus Woesearchaeota archaeon]